MSRCRCHTKCYGLMPTVGAPLAHGGFGTGCCNFSALIILILILLFFGKGLERSRGPCREEKGSAGFFGGNDGIFGGIIFIITLYFLTCCGPGKRGLQGGIY